LRGVLYTPTDEHLRGSQDILKATHLDTTDIAIAPKNHSTIIDGNNAMKHIFARGYLSQHSIAFFEVLHLGEYNLIAAVLQKGAHTHPTHTKRHIVPIADQCFYLSEQELVWDFHHSITFIHHFITSA
jgi:hypothetical protein